MIVPDGVAARIGIDAALSDITIDEVRFPKTDGIYESPDYDTAARRIDLTIQVGAADVNVW